MLTRTLCAYLKPWESPLQCSQSSGALLASRSAFGVIIRDSTYSAICHWPPPSHLSSHWPISWPPHFCLKLLLLAAVVRKVCFPHGHNKDIVRVIGIWHAFLLIGLLRIRLYVQLTAKITNQWHYLSQKGNWIRKIFKLMAFILNDVKISCREMRRHVFYTAVLKKELSHSSELFADSNTTKRTASPPTIPQFRCWTVWQLHIGVPLHIFRWKVKAVKLKPVKKFSREACRLTDFRTAQVMKL